MSAFERGATSGMNFDLRHRYGYQVAPIHNPGRTAKRSRHINHSVTRQVDLLPKPNRGLKRLLWERSREDFCDAFILVD